MKPVFELKAVMDQVKVYLDRIILIPTGIKSWGADGANEILFKNIRDIQFQEATFLTRGFMYFSTSDADISKPMTLYCAGNDKNTFVFKSDAQLEAQKIHDYIKTQRLNPSSAENEADIDQEVEGEVKIFYAPLPSRKKDFEEYRRLTHAQDWQGIFEFNNSNIDDFGTKKELGVLHIYLTDGEIVFALASGMLSQTDTSNSLDFGLNTWLVALTNKRVLLLDHAMLSSAVDTQSVRHDKIQAISASQGFMLGKLTIDIGNRSILIDNSNKKDVKVFAALANNWLEFKADQGAPNHPAASDPISELARLAELKSAGILDEKEFAAAKTKILNKI